jgi:hypothetical protein
MLHLLKIVECNTHTEFDIEEPPCLFSQVPSFYVSLLRPFFWTRVVGFKFTPSSLCLASGGWPSRLKTASMLS